MTDGQVLLRDGRRLGYAEFGDPAGKPGFFFHGWPSSRLEAQHTSAAAARLGIRIIAPDRPGIGLSDFQPRRTIGDWPADVVALADALGIDRFFVLGVSGGGPYAAACALKIPQRLTAAGIASGVAPTDDMDAIQGLDWAHRLVFSAGRDAPWLLRLTLLEMALLARRAPQQLVLLQAAALPQPDRAVFARPEIREGQARTLQEACRGGTYGVVREAALYLQPWGLRLEDIAMEVHLWQGEEDSTIPAAMGRYQARLIPRCRAKFYPGEGHFLFNNRTDEILGELAS